MERSTTEKFWGKNLVHDENNIHQPKEPHEGKNLSGPAPPKGHKMAVEEMPQHSKSRAEGPSNPKRPAKDPQSIVHLDLKGAAPKVKYLEQVGHCMHGSFISEGQ